ncbi:MAG TPA: T9SS type A sorting domain-containing protein [Fluviicola sp.]|nr:T9SS type A sorting domain-containing protein [Fluviicola sp.]
MKFGLLLTLGFFVTSFSGVAQVITAGDIAFTSAKVSNGDGFSFVTFIDLCPGTQIIFSDMPWRDETNKFCTSDEEFVITFTVTARIDRGTVVVYNDGAPGSVSMATGAATLSWTLANQRNNGFSSDGDNIFAFTGTYANPTFIAGMKIKDGTWMTGTVSCGDRQHTRLPAALTNGTNALYINPSGDGMRYTGTFTGTRAALRSAINNPANWSSSTNLSLTNTFTVTDMVQDPTSCLVLLPVDLVSFTGAVADDAVQLNWTTLSEYHNDHFDISVSTDGSDWTKIQTVPGAGTSMFSHDYSVVDEARGADLLYYKLTMVNDDSNPGSDAVISVKMKPEQSIEVFPNPATEFLTVVSDQLYGSVTVTIMDLSGKVYRREVFEGQTAIIPLADLKEGHYLVKVCSENAVSVLPLTKM